MTVTAGVIISICGLILSVVASMIASARSSGKFEQKVEDMKERLDDSISDCEKHIDEKIEVLNVIVESLKGQSKEHYQTEGALKERQAVTDQVLKNIADMMAQMNTNINTLLQRK